MSNKHGSPEPPINQNILKKSMVSTTIYSSATIYNIDNTFFLAANQHIRLISEGGTLKTGVMMLKIQLCRYRNSYIFLYINIENSHFKQFHNYSLTVFFSENLSFSIHIRNFFQKT